MLNPQPLLVNMVVSIMFPLFFAFLLKPVAYFLALKVSPTDWDEQETFQFWFMILLFFVSTASMMAASCLSGS